MSDVKTDWPVMCTYCPRPISGKPPYYTWAIGIYWDPLSRHPVAVCEKHIPTLTYGSPLKYVYAEEYAICEATAEVSGVPNRTILIPNAGGVEG